MRYAHLKCIQTGNGNNGNSLNKNHGKIHKMKGKREDKTLRVSFSVFYEAVHQSLDDQSGMELIPIVSITSKKEKNHCKKLEDFSVDYMLPVQVGHDWVGVVFRDNDCAMALLDGYDITNKAILCNPRFNVNQLDFFQNSYTRLKVVSDDIMIEPVIQREDSLETRLSISTETVPSPSLMSTLSGYSTPSSMTSISSFSLSPQSSVSPTFRPVAVPQVQPVAVGSVQMNLESECTA